MPTGYTARLCKGEVSFKQFVLDCAAAFGRRDEPLPEKKFETPSYHRDEMVEAKCEIQWLLDLSPEECEKEARSEYEGERKRYDRKAQDREALRERLLAMEAQVQAWKPPTKDHEQLKTFMLQQLELTIESDAAPLESFDEHCDIKKQSGASWRKAKLAEAREELKYHTDLLKQDAEETESLNRWLKVLRKNLK